MNNKNNAARSNARKRIAIALAASLTALWQLPDPAAQENNLAKPVENMIHKQEELNVLAQPSPNVIKPIRPLTI
jgi:hypothetical protein